MRTALLKLRKNSGRHAPPVSTNASKILNKTLLLFINTIIASSNCARGSGVTLFEQRPTKCPKNRSNPYRLPINYIYTYMCAYMRIYTRGRWTCARARLYFEIQLYCTTPLPRSRQTYNAKCINALAHKRIHSGMGRSVPSSAAVVTTKRTRISPFWVKISRFWHEKKYILYIFINVSLTGKGKKRVARFSCRRGRVSPFCIIPRIMPFFCDKLLNTHTHARACVYHALDRFIIIIFPLLPSVFGKYTSFC